MRQDDRVYVVQIQVYISADNFKCFIEKSTGKKHSKIEKETTAVK